MQSLVTKPDEEHIFAVCDLIKEEHFKIHLNSEVSQIICSTLNLVSDQRKVPEKCEEMRTFFTDHTKMLSKNDLVRIMSEDPALKVDKSIVTKCFTQLGSLVADDGDVQGLIDAFVHRCIKQLLQQAPAWAHGGYYG